MQTCYWQSNTQEEVLEETSFDIKRGEDIWIGRKVKKTFYGKGGHVIGTFAGKIVDFDDDEDEVGHRVFQVLYEDGDDEWMSPVDVVKILIEETVPASAASDTTTSSSSASAASATANAADIDDVAPTTKQKKPSKYQNYKSAPINGVYFLYDVETTGSKRNYDRIIQMSFISYDDTGKLLGNFSRLVNPGKVRISDWIKNNILPESKL